MHPLLSLPKRSHHVRGAKFMHESLFVVCTLLCQMVFMAVTSSGSAELIAVSSLFTYDVYRTYINPKVNFLHMASILVDS